MESPPDCADVAELADAHGSGPCTRKGVKVQVLSSAPLLVSMSYCLPDAHQVGPIARAFDPPECWHHAVPGGAPGLSAQLAHLVPPRPLVGRLSGVSVHWTDTAFWEIALTLERCPPPFWSAIFENRMASRPPSTASISKSRADRSSASWAPTVPASRPPSACSAD